MNLELKKAFRRQRGTVLLLVAWILLIMGGVAFFLLYRSGAEWAAVNSFSRRMRLQEIARARLLDCIVALNADKTDSDDKNDDWYFGGRIDEERDGAKITVLIEDEGSKPNINYISYFPNLEVFVPNEISTDPLIDWLDRNEEPLTNGAENSYYQGLTPPYKARNGFLSSLEELHEIKDGDKLYPKLAPEFTVFGKADPNIINGDTFTTLLYSHGFDKGSIEKMAAFFSSVAGKGVEKAHFFINADDFVGRLDVSLLEKEQLKTLFRFDGFCNVNFISLKGLQFLLMETGISKDFAKPIIETRDKQPFKNLDDVKNMIVSQAGNRFQPILGDYYTVVSTVIRYKIWVTYKDSVYYLDTVWERNPVTNAKPKWQSHPLSWRFLLNDEAPVIPEKEEQEANNEGQQ